jgi:hypothetical protein
LRNSKITPGNTKITPVNDMPAASLRRANESPRFVYRQPRLSVAALGLRLTVRALGAPNHTVAQISEKDDTECSMFIVRS